MEDRSSSLASKPVCRFSGSTGGVVGAAAFGAASLVGGAGFVITLASSAYLCSRIRTSSSVGLISSGLVGLISSGLVLDTSTGFFGSVTAGGFLAASSLTYSKAAFSSFVGSFFGRGTDLLSAGGNGFAGGVTSCSDWFW